MIQLYGHCWRGRTDCESIECVHDAPTGLTEEDFHNLNFKPKSFVCSGLIREGHRTVEQDCYRMCFYSDAHGKGVVDEMSDNDTNDLTSVANVISRALLFDSLNKANNGVMHAPTDDFGSKPIRWIGE